MRLNLALLTTILIAIPVLSCSCGQSSGSSPEPQPATAGIGVQETDGLGRVLSDSSLKLSPDASGALGISQFVEGRQSLFMRMPPQAGTIMPIYPVLAKTLEGRALLFSHTADDGSLLLGMTMLGNAQLPVNKVLLLLERGNTDDVQLKQVKAAPTSAVVDLQFVNDNELSWSFYSNGDYDQNGLVSIGDITPIGQNFGATVSDADWDSRRVADGDGNGAVTIADITPIGINFGSSVTDFIIRTSAAVDGSFTFVSNSKLDFATGLADSPGGPRIWINPITPVDGNFYAVVARDGSDEAAVRSNVVQYESGNLPPVPGLSIADSDVPPGAIVNLDASGSMDPDGSIVLFEFDVFGDGNFISNAADPIFPFQYAELGSVIPAVRITDDLGSAVTADFDPVTVSLGQLSMEVIDSADHAIYLSTGLLADGRPAVAWTVDNGMGRSLRFAHATTAEGTTWFLPDLLVGPTANLLYYPTLLTTSANSFVFYTRNGSINAWQTNASGDIQFEGLIRAADALNYGGYLSGIAVGDNTLIVHNDDQEAFLGGEIWCEYDSGGWMSGQISTPGNEGFTGSMALLGLPCMVYLKSNALNHFDIVFSQALSNVGDAWTIPVVAVPDGTYNISRRALSGADSKPRFIYADTTTKELLSAQADDSAGLGWGDPVLIDADTSGQLESNALFNLNGLPVVVYLGPAGNSIWLATALSTSSGEWNDSVELLALPGGINAMSASEHAGRPFIVYSDTAADQLKALVYTDS